MQHGQIVLGVTDGHRVVGRDPERVEGGGQTRGLGHAGGQEHQLAPVADRLHVRAEVAEDAGDGERVVRPAVEDHPARAKGDARPAERVSDLRRHRRLQLLDLAVDPQQRPVLGDHCLDGRDHVGEVPVQILQAPAGHEDHPQSGVPLRSQLPHQASIDPTAGRARCPPNAPPRRFG